MDGEENAISSKTQGTGIIDPVKLSFNPKNSGQFITGQLGL